MPLKTGQISCADWGILSCSAIWDGPQPTRESAKATHLVQRLVNISAVTDTLPISWLKYDRIGLHSSMVGLVAHIGWGEATLPFNCTFTTPYESCGLAVCQMQALVANSCDPVGTRTAAKLLWTRPARVNRFGSLSDRRGRGSRGGNCSSSNFGRDRRGLDWRSGSSGRRVSNSPC